MKKGKVCISVFVALFMCVAIVQFSVITNAANTVSKSKNGDYSKITGTYTGYSAQGIVQAIGVGKNNMSSTKYMNVTVKALNGNGATVSSVKANGAVIKGGTLSTELWKVSDDYKLQAESKLHTYNNSSSAVKETLKVTFKN